jgi:hypothetical protein
MDPDPINRKINISRAFLHNTPKGLMYRLFLFIFGFVWCHFHHLSQPDSAAGTRGLLPQIDLALAAVVGLPL